MWVTGAESYTCDECGGEVEVCALLGSHLWVTCQGCGADMRPSYGECQDCGGSLEGAPEVPRGNLAR